MKASSVLSIFLLMLVIILTSSFYDKFNDIESVFGILFWFFIIGLLTLSALMPFISRDNESYDDRIFCPGCDDELTISNAGGYRCFCDKCVDAMPEFPTEKGGYLISGKYPNFEWTKSDE